MKEPVADLAKLRCGHSVSKGAWAQFNEKPTRCPVCREVGDLGELWPMDDIKAAINSVKENIRWMEYLLPWDADMTQPPPCTKWGQVDLCSPVQWSSSSDVRSSTPDRRRSSSATLNGFISLNEQLPASPAISVAMTDPSRRASLESLSEPTPWEIKADPPISLNPGRQSYRDVTISTTCRSLAVVKPEYFTIYSVPRDHTRTFTRDDFCRKCVGYNDGRYGQLPGALSKGSACDMSFLMSVMNDERLCIICHTEQNHYLAVFNAETGQSIRRKKLSDRCSKIVMSPNGDMLALALRSGEVLVYPIGTNRDFDTTPIHVMKRNKQARQQCQLTKCMAISHDSAFICVCSNDDVIRTYQINMNKNTAQIMSIHDAELSYPEKHHGICNMALYLTMIGEG